MNINLVLIECKKWLGIPLSEQEQYIGYCKTVESPALYKALNLPNGSHYYDECLAYKTLVFAFYSGNIETCLNKFPTLLNARSQDGFTMLHMAAKNDDTQLLRTLISKNSSLFFDRNNEDKHTILSLAASNHQVDAVRAILNSPQCNLSFVELNVPYKGTALNQTSKTSDAYRAIESYIQQESNKIVNPASSQALKPQTPVPINADTQAYSDTEEANESTALLKK